MSARALMQAELTPTIERGRHDKEGRRQALLDAANAVFAEKGYDAATTREIADRACCSEGLIHRYFQGKRGLLAALMQSKAENMAEELRQAVPDRESLEDELNQLLSWQLETIWQRQDFMRTLVSRATIDPELGRFFGDAINEHRIGAIAEKLRRHQQAGRVRADADVDLTAHALAGLSFAEGFLAQVVFQRPRSEVRAICRNAASLLTAGLTPREDEPA